MKASSLKRYVVFVWTLFSSLLSTTLFHPLKTLNVDVSSLDHSYVARTPVW